MRNLKKVLALALAVVMLVGMMAMGAGAATYADVDATDNTVAIEVVSAIKALEGSNGNFRPDGKLTRADGAVIAARVALGRAVADKLVGATGIYTDVSAKHYASGAIAWATNEGYLSGDGSGAFRPNGSLYGVHFAKMLLCVLGYNAEIEGFTGTNYVQKITLTAAKAGLLTGLEDLELNGKITRGDAAAMAFNALNARRVSYTGGSNITIGDVTITQGAIRGYVDAEGVTFGSAVYGLRKDTVVAMGTANAVPATQWGIVTNGVWAGIAGTKVAATPAVTLKGEVKAAALLPYTVTATINNDIVTQSGVGVTQQLYINPTANLDGTNNVYTVVVSYEELSEVLAVKLDKENNVTKIVLETGTYVCADPETKTPATPGFAKLVEMGVEEGDLVLVNKTTAPVWGDWDDDEDTADTAQAVSAYTVIGAPAVATGVVTKKASDESTFVMGGATLTNAKNVSKTLTLGAASTALLSSEGYVLAVDADDEAPEAPNYLIVTETWSVASGNTKDPIAYHFAGVTMAGEKVEGQWKTNVYDNLDDDDDDTCEYVSELSIVTITDHDDPENVEVTYPTAHVKNQTLMVEYSINEKTGVYTLTNQDDNGDSTVPETTGTDIGKNDIELGATGTYFASNVEFVFLKGYKADGSKIVKPSTATGVQPVTANYYYFLDATETYVTRVFVLDAPVLVLPEVETNYVDGIYYVTGDIDATADFDSFEVIGEGDDMITLGTITVYVDGEKTELTLVVDNDTKLPIDAEGAELDIDAGFHKVELDEDGYATLTEIADACELNEYDASETILVESAFDLMGNVKVINGKYMIKIGGEWLDASAAIILDLVAAPNAAQNEILRDIAFNAANVEGAESEVGDVVTTALTAEIIYNNLLDEEGDVIDSSIIGIVVTAFTTVELELCETCEAYPCEC